MNDIEHYGITVSNLENSINFYEENFGFKKIREFDKPNLKLKGAILQLNTGLLEILAPDSSIKKQETYEKENLSEILRKTSAHFAIAVDNIKESYKKLKEKKVVLTDFNEKLFFCYDPDNILIEIRQKKS